MARSRVVVLAPPSLFSEGVASQLRQHQDRAEVWVVDSRQTDALDQAKAIQPAAVIFDASDPALSSDRTLAYLVTSLPTVRLVRLDSNTDRVRVVTSEERTAAEVRDLIEVVAPRG